MERKAVDGEPPFALGERDFFVMAKALAKTQDILTRMRTKGNLAGKTLAPRLDLPVNEEDCGEHFSMFVSHLWTNQRPGLWQSGSWSREVM
jgi:hypothetical protein